MNWKDCAIDDLKNYYNRKDSLLNLRERITALKESADGLKSVAADKVPVKGGASVMEDRLIDNIVQRERLNFNYRAVKRLVDASDRALNSLNAEERNILEGFYMRRSTRYIDDLCESTGLERAQVYRVKDRSLQKFTVSMYGITDY